MRINKAIFIFGIIVLVVIGGYYAKRKYIDPNLRLLSAEKEVNTLIEKEQIKNGDLIFQTSLSRQSIAIQLATKSKYSHCGIIYNQKGKFYVFEAVQPVKLTPLEKWIARGKDGKFTIKRIKKSNLLTQGNLEKMISIGNQFKGKDYDLTFEWSDDKIYCSELIWKIYQRATGLEIGKLQKLRDFDLSNENVQKIMKERYGEVLPLEEIVISPVSIFNSEQLETVSTNE